MTAPITVLRLPAVKARTGLSRTTIYHLIEKGRFPSQFRLNVKAIGWVESEIEDWLKSRIKASRSPTKRLAPVIGRQVPPCPPDVQDCQ